MTEYSQRRRFERADGLAAVTIEESDVGLFQFVIWKLYDPAPDIPEVGGPVWIVSRSSGLYPTLSAAENSARAEVEFLKV